MADLLSVIVGGLLGGGGTLVVSTYLHRLQTADTKKRKRANKFEELVAAVYEHDHWIDNLRRFYVVDFQGEIKVSPFAKIHAISDIYFPQFEKAIVEPATNTELFAGHQKVVTPYMQKQDALLAELRAFARREFQ
jgi:hypothetical protein